MPVSAGAMRHVVTLKRRSTEQRSSGQPKWEWLTFATRRAELVATAGREQQAAQQQVGRVPVLFRLRFLSGVLPAMRLVFDEKVYDIKSAVDPDGRREQLLLTTEELVGEAAP